MAHIYRKIHSEQTYSTLNENAYKFTYEAITPHKKIHIQGLLTNQDSDLKIKEFIKSFNHTIRYEKHISSGEKIERSVRRLIEDQNHLKDFSVKIYRNGHH